MIEPLGRRRCSQGLGGYHDEPSLTEFHLRIAEEGNDVVPPCVL